VLEVVRECSEVVRECLEVVKRVLGVWLWSMYGVFSGGSRVFRGG